MVPFSYGSFSSSNIVVDGYQPPPDGRPPLNTAKSLQRTSRPWGFRWCPAASSPRADNQTAPPVAIVNEAMAAQYWREPDPVGQRLQVEGALDPGGRHGQNVQVPEPGRNLEALLLCAAASRPAGSGLADPDASYPGTLLLVTHDRRMLSAVATNRQVEVADGQVAVR